MAKLFVGLAIAIMLAAAVLGFMAKGNIDQLQGVYRDSKDALARTQTNLKRAEGEMKKAQEESTAATAKLEAQTSDLNNLKKDKDDLSTRLAAVTTELDKMKADLAVTPTGTSGAPVVNVSELTAQMEQLRGDLTKAQAESAEKTAMVESLNQAKQRAEEQLANTSREVKRYQDQVSKVGLSGRIVDVRPEWNFVVLNIGDRQGAMAGSSLIVTRGGDQIARARITSVEPATSIADIIPGSVRRGVTVQPGDRVVFEGPRARTNAAPAPAAAPGASAALPQ
jgi:archaellum component FlaG (FlaF/FlaG flagellin family)